MSTGGTTNRKPQLVDLQLGEGFLAVEDKKNKAEF